MKRNDDGWSDRADPVDDRAEAAVESDLCNFALEHSPVIYYRARVEEWPADGTLPRRTASQGARDRDRPTRAPVGVTALLAFDYLSPNVAAILGLDPAAWLVPGGLEARLHPDDLDHYRRTTRALREEEQIERSFRVRLADGYRWLDERARVVTRHPDGGAALVGCLSLRPARRAPAATEPQRIIGDLLENLPVGLAVLDSSGAIIRCNTQYARAFHCSPSAARRLSGQARTDYLAARVRRIDGALVPDGRDFVSRWRQLEGAADGRPLEVELVDGTWKLLTVGATASGGRVHVQTDVTELRAAEQERDRLNQLLIDALESVPNAIGVSDASGQLTICNSAFAADYGVRPADLMGLHRMALAEMLVEAAERIDDRLLHDPQKDVRWWAERAADPACPPAEVKLKNGQWRLVSATAMADGAVAVIRTDITRLKRALQTLGASEDRYRALVHHAPIVIAELDRSGHVQSINPAGVSMSGRPDEASVIGRDVLGLVAPADRPPLQVRFEAAAAGDMQSFEQVLGSGDRAAILAASFVPIRGPDGGVSRIVAIGSDVTSIRRREGELRLARETLEDTLESLFDGVALYDASGKLVLCNQRYRAFYETAGTSLEPGMRWDEVLRLNNGGDASRVPGQALAWAEGLGPAGARSKAYFEFEHPCVKAHPDPEDTLAGAGESATRRWVAYGARPTRQGGTVTTLTDISERKQLEAEMTHSREALHQSEKLSALGELLASVAHELNNPLSVVVGQALLMKETAQDPRVIGRAGKIADAADRCATIVKTFLAMARSQPAARHAVAPNAALATALDLTASSLRNAGISVRQRLATTLPPVEGDGDQIVQVFTNLILNARHALQERDGARALELSSGYRAGSNEVVIKVRDNGPGVPDAIRSRIFEPLFTTKAVGEGTGVGLALCHRIVENHGGSLHLETNPDGGATFAVRLPAIRRRGRAEPASSAPRSASPRPAPSGAPSTTEHISRVTPPPPTAPPVPPAPTVAGLAVLVIDDEPDVAEMLADVVRADGHRVQVVHSGVDALEVMVGGTFDAILCDMRMPGLDGAQLFVKLQRSDPASCERLVFVTGDTLAGRARRFLETCGRPVLDKPVRPADVQQVLREIALASNHRGAAT